MVARWHLGKDISSLCITTEVWKKQFFPFKNELLFPILTQYNVQNQRKLVGSSFQHCMGGGGEVRQVKLYSRLTCALKCQKCKFVPRLLSMIVWMSLFSGFSHSDTLVPEAFLILSFFIWKFATRSADRSAESGEKKASGRDRWESHFHAGSALDSCQRCHFLLTNHKGVRIYNLLKGPGGSVLQYSEINYFVGRGEERLPCLQTVKLPGSCFHS